MLAEKATAPVSTAPCSEQNNTPESITPEPEPSTTTTTCAISDCSEAHNVYRLTGDKWICTDHIGAVVSLAANDVFSGDVHYTREFEAVLLW